MKHYRRKSLKQYAHYPNISIEEDKAKYGIHNHPFFFIKNINFLEIFFNQKPSRKTLQHEQNKQHVLVTMTNMNIKNLKRYEISKYIMELKS